MTPARAQRLARCPHTATALAVLSLLAAAQAHAQTQTTSATTAADSTPQRVEITGSIIKRVVDDSSLPVTSFRSEDLVLRGHTELKDLMLELPQANSLGTNAGTAGPMTSLRGFGPMRTLTLLDGRRLAKEPLTNQYVSVSVMPRLALERTDILRDGASSSYGSDAIGGVQAFYTKRSFQGVSLKLEALQPERSGGKEHSLGLLAGVGNLAKDGWNVYGALEVQRRDVVMRKDRPDLIDPAVLNSVGVNTTSGLGANAAPGNFTDPTNPTSSLRSLRYNPYYASGCLAPYSAPSTSGGRQTCFADNENNFRPFGNGNDITTLFARGTLSLGGGHKLSASLNHAAYQVDQYNDPTAVTVRLTKTHPYYPGNGIVPAVAGLTLAGRPIDVLWSVVDTGPRVREDHHSNDRLVIEAEGQFAGWDYRSGLNIGRSERDTRFGSGWVGSVGLVTTSGTATTQFLDARLNPFGLQTAEGLALLNSRNLEGQTLRLHRAYNSSLDFTASRDLMALAGGAMTLAVGAELRRDRWRAIGLSTSDPVASLNGAIDVLGGDSATAGARLSSTNSNQREITSLFSELEVPLLKTLTLNASVRADHYDDLKDTTVNPKLSLRYQPLQQLTLRASANTGYRAPSLPEIYTKETEITSLSKFDDPLLCPTVGGVKTPASGYSYAQVCELTDRFQVTKLPSNTGIKPETSRTVTFGFAFEPVKNFGLTVDYWQTQIDNVIGNRSLDFMLANPTLYPSLFKREADGTLSTNALINVPSNVGSLRGSGLDVSLKFVAPRTAVGQFNAGIDIAYLLKWDARSEDVNGNNWMSALAQYNDVVPVNPNAGISNNTRGLNNRWRHTAQVGWTQGDWSAQLSQRYQSAIRDQNSAARTGAGTTGPRNVAAYEQYNLALNYSGIKNLKLGLAVNNLFDKNPPLTNHSGYQGYLTSIADVVGRAYRLSAEYRF